MVSKLRRKLPQAIGGPQTERILTEESYTGCPEHEERKKEIREKLIDNLPQDVEAEAEFRDIEDQDLNTERYSGREEVESAYETWFADYDLDNQILECDLFQYDSGGEFEIRLKEVEGLKTRKWKGAHHHPSYHERDDFSDMRGREAVEDVETGETVAILEGEYNRAI